MFLTWIIGFRWKPLLYLNYVLDMSKWEGVSLNSRLYDALLARFKSVYVGLFKVRLVENPNYVTNYVTCSEKKSVDHFIFRCVQVSMFSVNNCFIV